jgi:hypothetical protein
VRFAIYPAGFEGPRVLAEISEDALRDVFGAQGGPQSLIEACQANFDVIESIAVDLFQRRPAWPILVETIDLPREYPPGGQAGTQVSNSNH